MPYKGKDCFLPAEDILSAKNYEARPIVILGEPGSGKTELLKWLASNRNPKQRPSFAKVIIRNQEAVPENADLVFIDGLDEVAALQEGDGLHDVLNVLQARRVRRFVVACRAAEWRSAAAKGIFQEWGLREPVEATIVPFSLQEAERFLAESTAAGAERASQVVAHYRDRGLSEWLGNPLTLQMLAKVAAADSPPKSVRELFEQFVQLSWSEWRKQTSAHQSLAKETCLDGLGAICASLVLGGHRAISLAPVAQVEPGDLPLAHVRSLPQVDGLSEDQWRALIDNRLLVPEGRDRFTYMHRRIGEYLGARWLARLADTERKRRRLIAMFQSTGGIVPASLRGMFGWLALDPHLAPEIIRTDPMAVILYGDADGLSPSDAEVLLQALIDLSRHNAWFRSGDRLNARSLVQPGMEDVARSVLEDASEEAGVRLTVAEQLRDAGDLSAFRPVLDQWLTDESVPWRLRDEAADILLAKGTDVDWSMVLCELSARSSSDSLRLALTIATGRELADIDDTRLAKLVYDRHDPAPNEVAKFWRLERAVPDARIDGLLDALSDEARRRLTDESGFETWDLQRLTNGLIVRRLKLGRPIKASRIWGWVSAFPQHARTASRDDEIAKAFAERDNLRRAVQHHVLIEPGPDADMIRPWFELRDRLPGCDLTEEDIVHHLKALPDGDPRWWFLVKLTRHGAEDGKAVRQAALRHVITEDDRARLEELANPRKPQWEIEEEKRQKQRAIERHARWEAHRQSFTEHRQRLLSGDWAALVGPADVYVGWAREDFADLPSHERIKTWLGPGIAADVFKGFEAWLQRSADLLTPTQIGETYAEGKRMRSGAILVAALAERQRAGAGFADLSDDRILAGMLEYELGLYQQLGVGELGGLLEQELRARNLYEQFARKLIEPQLRAGKEHPTGLYALMRGAGNAEVGAQLAAEWLKTMADLPARAEEEMIDCLMREGRTEALRDAASARLALENLPDERRRNWQAVALIIDFDAAVQNIGAKISADPSALWIFRSRLAGRRREHETLRTNAPALLAWIVSAFRQQWPNAPYPGGVHSGDTNPWDASDFLRSLINSLAADPSDEAAAALRRLADVEDGYQSHVRNALAEQADLRAERDFQPVSVPELRAVLTDSPPRTPKDLQAWVLEALDEVQRQIRSSPTDPWRRFYRDADKLIPQGEEHCSDYLAELLKAAEPNVRFERETHLAADRETDIWCSVDGAAIPIEAKGQWHPELWKAPDNQLARQQASDHRADGYGIYLIYWFGAAGKPLAGPPRGSGVKQLPASPEELVRQLQAVSPALRSGRVRVFVLDLSPPSA